MKVKSVSVDDALDSEIGAFAERMEAEQPGVRATWASAARVLLRRGIAATLPPGARNA